MYIDELTIQECQDIVSAKRFGRLACVNHDQPYIVPFQFEFDGADNLYAFSTPGQKITFMRSNPMVCVEIDDIKNQFEWNSVVIMGTYEELPDTPEFRDKRILAHQQLSRHAMWWQPAYVAGTHYVPEVIGDEAIYFRIVVSTLTGRHAAYDHQAPEAIDQKITFPMKPNWFSGFWKTRKPKTVSSKAAAGE